MCWQAALPLIVSAAGTGAEVYSQQQALAKQDREAADGILRQAALNKQASAKVGDTIQKLQQSNPEEDINKRQTAYLDALRRAQPAVSKALPSVAGGSKRFAEDVSGARAAGDAEAGTSANLMARIDAPGIQRTREGEMANDTLSQLAMLGDQSSHEGYLTRLRMAMQKPNPWLAAGGEFLKGYGQAKAVNSAFNSTDAFDDGTGAAGLTAQQRRELTLRGGY